MIKYVMLALVLATLGGCAMADWVMGVDPVTGEDKPESAPIEQGGNLLSIWLPWAAAAASGLKAIYDNFRKRQYLTGLQSVVAGVEDVMAYLDENKDGKLSKEEIVSLLQRKQDQAGTVPLIAQILAFIKK